MKITPKPNGPNLVQDAPILKDSDGTIIDTDKSTYGLCRCGLSKNKPFCDGSHFGEFSSDNGDAKLRNTPIEYKGTVEGKSVTVSYTPVLCGHVAECQRLQKALFDPSKRPWIQPENGSLEGILSVIRACPSGALSVAVDDEELHHIDGEISEIQLVENGPVKVKNVPIDAEFNGARASEKEYILCRCGQSKNKPFCDGTHHDVKWKSR